MSPHHFLLLSLLLLLTISPTSSTPAGPPPPPPPAVVSAISTPAGTVRVQFDHITNRGGNQGYPRPCSELCATVKRFLNSPTVIDWSSTKCQWISGDVLELRFPMTSNFDPDFHALTFNAGNILDRTGTSAAVPPNQHNISNIPSTIPYTVINETVAISLRAPSKFSVCDPNLVINVEAEFSCGRPFDATDATLTITPALLNSYVATFDPALMVIVIPSIHLQTILPYTVTLTLKNWQGQSATASITINPTKSLLLTDLPPGNSNYYITTTILGSQLYARQVQSLDLHTRFLGQVHFAPECLPAAWASSVYMAWNWTVYGPLTDITQTYSSAPVFKSFSFLRPSLTLPRFSLPTPGNAPTLYALRLVTRVGGITGIPISTEFGSDLQILRVEPAPMVAIVKPIPATMLNGSSIVLDATGSCDPNVVSQCDMIRGLPDTFVGSSQVTVTWQWFDFNTKLPIGNSISGVTPTPVVWNMVGVFTSRLTITPVQGNPARLSRVVESIFRVISPPPAPPPGAGSGPPPQCIPPQIKLPVFQGNPPQITLENSPLFVKADISGGTANMVWSWQVRKFDINTTADTDYLPIPSDIALFSDRPVIAFLPHGLQLGQMYTFRLTSTYFCPGSSSSLSVSADMSFLVNDPPFAGRVSVYPAIGIEFTDMFQLVASAWTDSNAQGQPDLPFMYQFTYARPQAFTDVALGEWLFVNTLSITLASGRTHYDTIGTIYVFCRDVFGAVSQPQSTTVQVLPLFNLATFSLTDLPNPDNAIKNVYREGGTTEEALMLVSALSNAASTLGSVLATGNFTNVTKPEVDAIVAWRRQVGVATVGLVEESRLLFANDESMDQVALQFATLAFALQGSFSNLSPLDLYVVTGLMEGLLLDANRVVQANLNDPQTGIVVAGLVDGGMASTYLEILGGLALGVANAKFAGDLQADPGAGVPPDWASYALVRLRDMLRLLINVLMQGYQPGAPASVVKSQFIELSLSREFRAKVGAPDAVGAMKVNDAGERGSVACSLPPDALNSTLRPRNVSEFGDLPDTIDMAIIHFRFNLLEILNSSNLPTTNNTKAGRQALAGYKLPNYTVTDVVSLIFISNENPDDLLDPTELHSLINVTVPLPADYVLPTTNQSAPACGAYDETLAGWSPSGCVMLDIDVANGFMVCGCTHASDFSAWNSFLEDAAGTANAVNEAATLTTDAILVVGVLLPCLLMTWFLFLLWAHYRDMHDGARVEMGALMLLTKNKLRMLAMQRRFFKLLRQNASSPQPLKLDDQMLVNQHIAHLQQQRDLAQLVERKKPRWWRRIPLLIRGWLEGLMMDHGVFGTWLRFDPFYTRTQRVTVILAVVAGNLFAASLLFNLKTAQDVSVYLEIGVVVAASVVVAVPIKIFVRTLFRSTEPPMGSLMHRVTQIYRITEMHHDLLPGFANSAEQLDIEMILAFKRVALAQGDLDVAIQFRDELNGHGGRKCCTCRRIIHEDTSSSSSPMSPSTMERLGMKPTSTNFTMEQIDAAVARALSNLSRTKKELRNKCDESRKEWARVPRRVSQRVETLRKQQSSVFRFAALVYDEAGTRPRERTKRCSHPAFLIVGWSFVLAYFCFCLIWCAFWVINRQTNSSVLLYVNGTTLSQDQVIADSNYVINAWLIAAFSGSAIGLFIVEPVLGFFRFGVAAWCIKRFGNGTAQGDGAAAAAKPVEQDPSVALIKKARVMDAVNGKHGGERDTTAQFWVSTLLDATADIIDSLA